MYQNIVENFTKRDKKLGKKKNEILSITFQQFSRKPSSSLHYTFQQIILKSADFEILASNAAHELRVGEIIISSMKQEKKANAEKIYNVLK